MRKGPHPTHRPSTDSPQAPAPSWMRIEEISRLWLEETGESRASLERELSEWYAAFGLRADAKKYTSNNDNLAALMELMGSPHIDREVFALFCDETGRPRPIFWFKDRESGFAPTAPEQLAPSQRESLQQSPRELEDYPEQARPNQIRPLWIDPEAKEPTSGQQMDRSPRQTSQDPRLELEDQPPATKNGAYPPVQEATDSDFDPSPEVRFRRAALSRMAESRPRPMDAHLDSEKASQRPSQSRDSEAGPGAEPQNGEPTLDRRLDEIHRQERPVRVIAELNHDEALLRQRRPQRHSVLQSEPVEQASGVSGESNQLRAPEIGEGVLSGPPPKRRRRFSLAYAAAAVLVVGVGISLFAWQTSGEPSLVRWAQALVIEEDPASGAIQTGEAETATSDWSISSVANSIGTKLAETFEADPIEAGLSDPKSVSSASRQQVAEGANLILLIQEYLKESGFYSGPLTGRLDGLTRQEIGKYKRQHGLGDDAWVTLELLDHLEVSALTKRAELLSAEGNFVLAIAAYDQLIRMQPQNSHILMERAMAYKNAGLAKKAMADLDRAVLLDPDYVDAYMGRAKFNYETGQYGSALKDYFLGAKAWVTKL
ncbi:MAG: tetratricopeptide repeat protein [Pseudomonadota bacterium]